MAFYYIFLRQTQRNKEEIIRINTYVYMYYVIYTFLMGLKYFDLTFKYYALIYILLTLNIIFNYIIF